jgi:hypothetical protein
VSDSAAVGHPPAGELGRAVRSDRMTLAGTIHQELAGTIDKE